MLQEGLVSLFAGTHAIAALLGTAASRSDKTNGIFPVTMPEATPLPAIVYTQIAGEGFPSNDGANALHSARIQFSCYGESYADAKHLQRALKQLLEATSLTLEDGTELHNAILVLESDAWEEGPFIYHAPIDFTLLYRDVGA